MRLKGRKRLVAGVFAVIAACGGDDPTDYLEQPDPSYPPPSTGAVSQYNGPGNGGDSPTAIATDGDGNTFIAGLSYGTGSAHDIVVIKYNAQLSEVWTARYNGPENQNDVAVAMIVDDAGNVYVTGYSDVGDNELDIVTIKYDAGGAEQWVSRYDTPEDDRDEKPTAIATDLQGNVYIVGNADLDFLQHRAITVAYSAASGTQLWADVSALEFASAASDPRAGGGVLVTGTSFDSAYQRCWNAVFPSANYITKSYAPDGTVRWTVQYDGPCDKSWLPSDSGDSVDDSADVMTVDPDGSVYVVGVSGSRVRTVKYSSTGAEQWVADYIPPGGVSEGGPFPRPLTVPKKITLDMERGRAFVLLTSCCTDATFPDTLFIATLAYDVEDGDLQWAVRYDETGVEEAGGLAVSGDGDVIVAGLAETVDPLTGEGEQHILTLAYDVEGDWLWEARYSGIVPRVPPRYTGVVVRSDGAAIVTGTTFGGETDRDIVTMRYTVR
jgi:hypothetical protein